MGCGYERFDFVSPNEEPFTSEETLGYDSVSLDKFIRDIRTESENEEITWPKLQGVFQNYEINSTNVRDKEKSEGKFYNKFLTSNPDWYRRKNLILLAILLCRGTPEQKGMNLFQNFSVENTLLKSEISDILRILLKIALDDLPCYIYDLTIEGKTKDPDKIAVYHKQLLRKSASAHAALLSAITKEELNQQEFIKVLKTTKLTAICTSSALRTFASDS